VVDAGRLVGTVSFESARKVGARDPMRPVRDGMIHLMQTPTLAPDESLDDAWSGWVGDRDTSCETGSWWDRSRLTTSSGGTDGWWNHGRIPTRRWWAEAMENRGCHLGRTHDRAPVALGATVGGDE
jgi:hypothetical protein